jgi:hypothetical protein
MATATDVKLRPGFLPVPTFEVAQDLLRYVFCLSDGWTRVRTLGLGPEPKAFREYMELTRAGGVYGGVPPTVFRLPGKVTVEYERYDPVSVPWPPFMAFALLHCKNVVVDEHVPDEKTQRRARKAGNPPRVTYQTLRVEVPVASHRRQAIQPGDLEDSGPRVRFHLCAGHFKHLQSPRYVNKRGQLVWCPAHWKGAKELGEVHKNYQVVPSKA